jgi:hypothetical protein
MATVTLDAETPGKGAQRPVLAKAPGVLVFMTGSFSFDSSYPTGGEDFSSVLNEFKTVLGMFIEQPIQAGAQTGKFIRPDYTNKKLQLFTNAAPFAEVANASDQSLITGLKFIVWGLA